MAADTTGSRLKSQPADLEAHSLGPHPPDRRKSRPSLANRGLLAALRALKRGEFSVRLPDDLTGIEGKICETFNELAQQQETMELEFQALRRAVGREGRTQRRMHRNGALGGWARGIGAINGLLDDLTLHTDEIARVVTAVSLGDLSQVIDEHNAEDPLQGDFLRHARAVNDMVDRLSLFGSEVTRVAQEVGIEGKLGVQATIPGVSGVWKELTDSVNLMASNLTSQVREIARVTTAVAQGDLTKTVHIEVKGEVLLLKNTINTMVDQLSGFADEVARVARDVGLEGQLGGQAEVRGVSGIWRELTDNVNLMASNLTNQVRDIAQVTTSVATGDLSKTITVEARGELRELKNTINIMVGHLRSFAGEVTRVAREVGTEGVLGGQAEVRGVSGTWRELTDNVNIMAHNLTGQVRGIARVVTAVANGDLKQQLQLDSKGEIATLVDTINNMIVTLSTFADQVSGVARDVGVEGKLGGQADVPGAAGIWRDLTNNVNELAGNLTQQVRAIGDVATAVTKGDLTRTIDVEARGEVALLKDNINQMIRALAETTKVNQEQDWLKTNLTRFTRMLQGQRDLLTVADQVLSELAPVVGAQHGTFYMARRHGDQAYLELFAAYACTDGSRLGDRYAFGESLIGQAGKQRKRILLTDVPGDYLTIGSSLGKRTACSIVVEPVLFEGEVKGVIELASLHAFTDIQLALIEQLIESLGIVVATIEATMRTDDLLRQSQGMARELRAQQEELQQTNEALAEKARQLIGQKEEVEHKNQEVELAKQALEEKARQLALTSKYKSQFLANMSHELRTPLNSLLILSRHLADNHTGNLNEKQAQYAHTVHQAGTDLLSLINEVLDLAKIESGTMAIEITDVRLDTLQGYIDRSFRHLAQAKGLKFQVQMEGDLPEVVATDDMRLRQVLRNLLSNAIKFTEQGRVTVTVERGAGPEGGRASAASGGADAAIAFRVSDTGIGIPHDKQSIIFEAFQQVDGGTSRRHGGTGLGLSISREIAQLLGGELRVTSAPGEGSMFTLLLPQRHSAQPVPQAHAPPVERLLETLESPPPAVEPLLFDGAGKRISSLGHGDPALRDKKVLLVDDDMRNVFAITAVLEQHDMRVVYAENGQEAIHRLSDNDDVDIILMDIMMPEMDGYEAMRRIRAMPRWNTLPMVALTAKAMQEDCQKSIVAGASDYVTKPVAADELISLLRAWLGG